MKRQSLYILVFLGLLALCGAAFGDYCSASGGSSYEHINGVEVGTISNMTGLSSYTDYTYLSTEMYIGFGYSITVTNGDAYSSDQCGVWVDWNADEDFDDVNETIVMSGGSKDTFNYACTMMTLFSVYSNAGVVICSKR